MYARKCVLQRHVYIYFEQTSKTLVDSFREILPQTTAEYFFFTPRKQSQVRVYSKRDDQTERKRKSNRSIGILRWISISEQYKHIHMTPRFNIRVLYWVFCN
jgi:hypothetical protein